MIFLWKKTVPPTVGQEQNLNLRNADDICGIFATTEKFKNSIREYNQLPIYISLAIVQFTRLIKVNIVSPKTNIFVFPW